MLEETVLMDIYIILALLIDSVSNVIFHRVVHQRRPVQDLWN